MNWSCLDILTIRQSGTIGIGCLFARRAAGGQKREELFLRFLLSRLARKVDREVLLPTLDLFPIMSQDGYFVQITQA